jgi:hypothetical protein
MRSFDEATWEDILRGAGRMKFYLLTGAVIGLAAALGFILAVTPRYQAAIVVAPADGYALGDYASSGSVDRSISLPFWRPMETEGVSTDFYRFIYTARGQAAADILMKDASVKEGITADPRWHGKAWSAPVVSEYLERHVDVMPLGATPLRRITYDHPDPAFAAAMLRKIHLVADQLIRRDRRKQSQARVAYLETSLSKTVQPEHRRGITALLLQQEHVLMLANLDEPYSAIVVEPAASAARPSWPAAYLVVPAFVLAGLVFGMLAGVFKQRGRR